MSFVHICHILFPFTHQWSFSVLGYWTNNIAVTVSVQLSVRPFFYFFVCNIARYSNINIVILLHLDVILLDYMKILIFNFWRATILFSIAVVPDINSKRPPRNQAKLELSGTFYLLSAFSSHPITGHVLQILLLQRILMLPCL